MPGSTQSVAFQLDGAVDVSKTFTKFEFCQQGDKSLPQNKNASPPYQTTLTIRTEKRIIPPKFQCDNASVSENQLEKE